jgi:hypoxia up-regulated 1
MFYNMGASYTQVSLVSFKSVYTGTKDNTIENQYVNTIDEAWDSNLGGRNFDYNIVRHFLEMYNKNKLNRDQLTYLEDNDNKEAKKAEKILPSAIKYKEILSANKEVPVYILGVEEGLSNNIEGVILTRKQFEDFSQDEVERVYAPIEEILKRNPSVTLNDIQAIEFIGGGHRIPKIKEYLQQYIPAGKLGHHMNGDDAIALGAAFIAANVTNNFPPNKRIFLNGNGFNFDIKIGLENLSEGELPRGVNFCPPASPPAPQSEKISVNCVKLLKKEAVIFKARQGYNVEKVVNFKHDSDFKIKVYEVFNNIGKNSTTNKFMTFTIKGITEKIIPQIVDETGFSGNIPKIKLKFNLDKLGILTLRAELIYEIITFLNVIKDPKSGKLDFKYSVNKAEPFSASELIDEISKIRANKNFTKTEKEKYVTKLKDEVGKNRTETKTRALDAIILHEYPLPLDKNQIMKSKVKLNTFDSFDEKRSENVEKRNQVENILYNKKEWINSEKSIQYGTGEELNVYRKGLNEINEWYENEGRDASGELLNNKITQLDHLFKIFNDRIEISNRRDNAVEYFYSELQSTLKEVKNLVKEKYWLEEYFNNTFMETYNQMDSWLKEKLEKQKKIFAYEVNKI